MQDLLFSSFKILKLGDILCINLIVFQAMLPFSLNLSYYAGVTATTGTRLVVVAFKSHLRRIGFMV